MHLYLFAMMELNINQLIEAKGKAKRIDDKFHLYVWLKNVCKTTKRHVATTR
jgi:hypothetical protein